VPRVHFLNVNDGDCSIIEHLSGRVTLIDVSAAKEPAALREAKSLARFSALERRIIARQVESKKAKVSGNFNQSEYPDDPIAYMNDRGLTSVFRFISTHPDMDHLDGIKAFFEAFSPENFWDTDNTKELDDFGNGLYDPDDWEFYTSLRDGDPGSKPKRLTLYAGARGSYFNRGKGGKGNGDGLYILAPTPKLVADANEAEDWNDSSYVILYRTLGGKRILFAGDSHDATWEHILDNYKAAVTSVDVLMAPHHGRDSDRSYDFLDVVKPRITLFGNAPSEHLAYDEWNSRDLLFITNNQAGTMILEIKDDGLRVYVSHESFAEAFTDARDYATRYSEAVGGWFIGRWK
jgi:beta-lactamase superfamily II metal-dependent hydrolase